MRILTSTLKTNRHRLNGDSPQLSVRFGGGWLTGDAAIRDIR